jgi:hypothetical protein
LERADKGPQALQILAAVRVTRGEEAEGVPKRRELDFQPQVPVNAGSITVDNAGKHEAARQHLNLVAARP